MVFILESIIITLFLVGLEHSMGLKLPKTEDLGSSAFEMGAHSHFACKRIMPCKNLFSVCLVFLTSKNHPLYLQN